MDDHFNLFPWYERIPASRARLMIQSACGLASQRFQKGALWVLVGHLFGEGSTIAHEICRYAKLDPHEKVSVARTRLVA